PASLGPATRPHRESQPASSADDSSLAPPAWRHWRPDPSNRAGARTSVDGIITRSVRARRARARPALPPPPLHRASRRYHAWAGCPVAARLHARRIVAVRRRRRASLVGTGLSFPDARARSPDAASFAALVLARTRPRAPLGFLDADRRWLVARPGEGLRGRGRPERGRRARFRRSHPGTAGGLAGGRGAGGGAVRARAWLRWADRARAALQPL